MVQKWILWEFENEQKESQQKNIATNIVWIHLLIMTTK